MAMPHPLECCCPQCLPSSESFPIYGEQEIPCSETQAETIPAEKTVRANVLTDILDDHYYAILASLFIIALWLLYIYLSSIPTETGPYFYQDLNSVKIYGIGATNPEVIAAIHHWQKYPFGESPMWGGLVSVLSVLLKPLTLVFALSFFLLLSSKR
uniref:Beta-D protein n=2 Tax=Barley stripe mosaic virus TaxID=12327 RepID=Q89453_BSMV|nr:beta-d protein [Barley stripe mosaic virus]AAA79159.1 beta-d protein [Barley stripe mosaic virus]AAA79163.1 beta-d protein [Barley stripe mosaic virus]AIT18339.1 beta d protein [Barley stripe mosaic virus]UZP17065.1 ORF4 [Barley stripe mosaic virus]